MPKKTRRQKIASEKRKLHLPHRSQPIVQEVATITSEAQEPKQQVSVKPQLTSTYDMYFKKDLRKSILISSVILFFEAGFYFAQQYGIIHITKLFQF